MSRINFNKALNIQAEREKVYGEPLKGHALLARAWSSILEEAWQTELPKELDAKTVCLMLVALKILRAARPGYSEDHFLDAVNYLDFAHALSSNAVPYVFESEYPEDNDEELEGTNDCEDLYEPIEKSFIRWQCVCGRTFGNQAELRHHEVFCSKFLRRDANADVAEQAKVWVEQHNAIGEVIGVAKVNPCELDAEKQPFGGTTTLSGPNVVEEFNSIGEVIRVVSYTDRSNYRCLHCPTVYSEIKHLESHMKICRAHPGAKHRTCHKCNIVFPTMKDCGLHAKNCKGIADKQESADKQKGEVSDASNG